MDRTCSECGGSLPTLNPRRKFCSQKCRDSSRRVPCAHCGELMHLGSTSRPPGEAMHNRCITESTGHGVSRYERGCRCGVCREAKTAAVRKYMQSSGYWSRPDVVARRRSLRSTADARAKEKARWSRYYSENRAELIDAYRDKSARRKGAPVIPFTVEQLDARLSMFAGCWICGAVLDDFHIDHVKPLSKGGWHCLSNLRPACPSCNISKGAKWPLEEFRTLTASSRV